MSESDAGTAPTDAGPAERGLGAAAGSLALRGLLGMLSPQGPRARLSILIFHRVLPAPDPLMPYEPDVERFDRVLGWLADWFVVLPLGEAVERLAAARLPARAACITFDDGYADNYTCALPALQRHGLPATFFVATGFLDGGRMWNDVLIEAVRATPKERLDLERLGLGILPTTTAAEKCAALSRIIPALKHLPPAERTDRVADVVELCGTTTDTPLMMTSAQVRALRAAGMEIGAHTVTHPILAKCDERTVRDEIAQSRECLEALLGERVGLFAYPNGKLGNDYTPGHPRIVADLGFDAAVTTNPGASRAGDDLFQLRRFTPWEREAWRFGIRLALNLLPRRDG